MVESSIVVIIREPADRCMECSCTQPGIFHIELEFNAGAKMVLRLCKDDAAYLHSALEMALEEWSN